MTEIVEHDGITSLVDISDESINCNMEDCPRYTIEGCEYNADAIADCPAHIHYTPQERQKLLDYLQRVGHISMEAFK
jgi:hypothetical protein